jgi:hypothetical protein
VGFAGDPLGFTPRELCSWGHRFDDPHRRYRTLYCAEERITACRETLASFRPNLTAIREFRALFGADPPHAAAVPWEWLEQHALAPARIDIASGHFVDVDDLELRREFEMEHIGLLAAHGFDHLDVSELRSRARAVTRTLSRWCFDRGAAGILFRSNLDDLRCFALFEGRSSLTGARVAEPLRDRPAELLTTCKDFGLTLGASP